GEAIIADGEIIASKYLSLDESALTGESDYVSKSNGDKVLSGAFVVTGECIYVVKKVGSENYLNKLGQESLTYRKTKSRLEKIGEKYIMFFVFTGIITSVINFL